jgi:N6-adenosine-specific RNA methylase IME4
MVTGSRVGSSDAAEPWISATRRTFPLQQYDVVAADLPWSYYGSRTKWGAAAKHYATMADDDLLSLPIRTIMAPRSVLFLWATCPRLDFAIRCIDAWKLYYRGVAFVWIKTRADGIPVRAQGVRPSIVKPTTELVLAASPVKRGRPMPLADEAIRQTVFAPRTKHSRKPDLVMDEIEKLYPRAKRLELFARRSRAGWDSWGDEI